MGALGIWLGLDIGSFTEEYKNIPGKLDLTPGRACFGTSVVVFI